MTETEGLNRVAQIVAQAMPPDSGASVTSLLSELMDVVCAFNLDPVESVEILEDEPPPATAGNVVPLRPDLH